MPSKDDRKVVMIRDDAAELLGEIKLNIGASPNLVSELTTIYFRRMDGHHGGQGGRPQMVNTSDIILLALQALKERHGLTNKETK